MTAILFTLVFATCYAAPVNQSPVGTWQMKISAPPKEILYITFNIDGTLDGYGISISSFALYTLSGTWTVDSKGKVLGNYTENLGSQSFGGSFVGKAVNGKKINARVTSERGNFTITGVPATSFPDISGHWVGQDKESGVTLVETYDITAGSDFGIFDFTGAGSGPDGAYTLSGEVVVNSLRQANSLVQIDFASGDSGLAALTGSFNVTKGTASLKGKSASGQAISIKLTR